MPQWHSTHLGRLEEAQKELAKAGEYGHPDTVWSGDTDHVAARIALEQGQPDAAEPLSATSVRRREGHANRRAGILPGITLATIHARAGERAGYHWQTGGTAPPSS